MAQRSQKAPTVYGASRTDYGLLDSLIGRNFHGFGVARGAMGHLDEYDAHHLDNIFLNGVRENIMWVHIPVFLLASKTIITFCKAVVAPAAQATPTGP